MITRSTGESCTSRRESRKKEARVMGVSVHPLARGQRERAPELDVGGRAADEDREIAGLCTPAMIGNVIVGKSAAIEKDSDFLLLAGAEKDLCETFQFFCWTRNARVGISNVNLSHLGGLTRSGVFDLKGDGYQGLAAGWNRVQLEAAIGKGGIGKPESKGKKRPDSRFFVTSVADKDAFGI